MDSGGWAQKRSFNCDMYWPLLNMYWESSGFGLQGFLLGFYIRGCFTNSGKGLRYIHMYVCVSL